MNLSFYSASVGAAAQQEKLDVVANNFANINTEGYKTKNSTFADLLYTTTTGAQGGKVQRGSGTKLDKTDTIFDEGSYIDTDSKLDFYINGRGFFALKEPATGEVVYTRNGNFSMSQKGDDFYLSSCDGYFVLDKSGNYIKLNNLEDDEINPAVYDFSTLDGMRCVGDSNYMPTEKNGEAILSDVETSQCRLEGSNVDISKEMTKVIEAQRAYQFALKMVQTSDEIQTTINSLRG
ncbi:MAG TPA: flagellar hook-basal body protein [Lachnospiraceae bacterium]|nr:flagellar hook-basal body protein [Lachnospiraceae bacterium]